jgi:hypothetical protein
MERVIAYVDGHNLYYGLRSKGWKRFYWLNIQSLASQFLKPHQNLVMTKYFTTVIKQPEAKRRRQAAFLDALQTLSDYQIYCRASFALQKAVRGVLHTGHVELSKSLFPERVVRADGFTLRRPAEWQ